MFIRCGGCNEQVKWYHKTGCNGHWHRRCWLSWKNGSDVASKWAENECRDAGHPTPIELYKQKNSLGWRVENGQYGT